MRFIIRKPSYKLSPTFDMNATTYHKYCAVAIAICCLLLTASCTDSAVDPPYEVIPPPVEVPAPNSSLVPVAALIDVDGNGIDDFNVWSRGFPTENDPMYSARFNTRIEPLAENALHSMFGIGIRPLEKNFAVNGRISWSTASEILYYFVYDTAIGWHQQPRGPWTNATRKYLPVRLVVNGLYFYGWVEMSFVPNEGLVVHDHAIASEPGVSIGTGVHP